MKGTAFGFLSLFFFARAAADESEDRPAVEELFLGEIAFTQAAMELQVTASARLDVGAGENLLAYPFEVEFGITDRLQLAAGALPETLLDSDGNSTSLSTVSVEVLYGFLREGPALLTVSAGVEGTVPVDPPAPLDRGYAIEPFACAYRPFGLVHANLTLGAELEFEDEPEESEGLSVTPEVAVGFLFPIGSIVPTVELLAELGDAVVLQGALGTIWRVRPEFQVGLAGHIQRSEASSLVYGGFLSVTWEVDLSSHTPPTGGES